MLFSRRLPWNILKIRFLYNIIKFSFTDRRDIVKKLLSTVLAASMILTAAMSTVTASAVQTDVSKSGACTKLQKSFGDDDFVIDPSLSMADRAYIQSYKGNDDIVYVPDQIHGVPVKGLSLNAFQDCSAREVHLPESIDMICAWSFSNCPNLEKVTLPEQVEQLQLASFENCPKLKSVNLPGNIDVIELDLFKNCISLESIHIPDGNIQAIKANAFGGCSSLKDVYIPQSVTMIGPGAFQDCTSLEEITLPDKTKYIGYWAFSGCTSLKKINIPATVTDIGDEAFKGCSDLVIYGEKDSFAEEYAHSNKIKFFDGTDIYDPAKADSDTEYDPDYEYIVNDDGTVTITGFRHIETDVVIPSTINEHPVTGIGEGVFASAEPYTSTLKRVLIADGINRIDNKAFENCTSLEFIKLPPTLETIGDDAFANVTSMKEIELPEGLKTIGKNNFTGMFDFFSADMPYSLESIGEGSFKNNMGSSLSVYDGSVAEQYAKDNGIATLKKINKPEDPKSSGMYGDVNKDDKVSGSDSLMIQRYVIKLVKLDDDQLTAADVDNNGKVDNRDSLNVLRYTIGVRKDGLFTGESF